jgi:clan AA aspartic protease (TIGR02281 family)
MITRAIAVSATALLPSIPAFAEQAPVFSVQMQQRSSGAFYLRGTLAHAVDTDLLIDTGSSYVVLSGRTFEKLDAAKDAVFKRRINGATANGRVHKAKVYELSTLALGADCVLRSVEVVVLPGAERDILGLSALKRLQPFTFDIDPMMLRFSGCAGGSQEDSETLAGSVPPAPEQEPSRVAIAGW